jgi:hypothetical protein
MKDKSTYLPIANRLQSTMSTTTSNNPLSQTDEHRTTDRERKTLSAKDCRAELNQTFNDMTDTQVRTNALQRKVSEMEAEMLDMEEGLLSMKAKLRSSIRKSSQLREHYNKLKKSFCENEEYLDRVANLSSMWTNTQTITFSDGACLVPDSILEERLSLWKYIYSFKNISSAHGLLIIGYLYTDTIPFDQMSMLDVLKLLKTVNILLIPGFHIDRLNRIEELCQMHLLNTLQVDDYRMMMSYIKSHELGDTHLILMNHVHRNIEKLIAHERENPDFDMAALSEMFAEYNDLRVTVSESTFNDDLKRIIDFELPLDLSVEELSLLLKEHCPKRLDI